MFGNLLDRPQERAVYERQDEVREGGGGRGRREQCGR